MISSFEPEGVAAASKSELWRRISCALFLMILALLVPMLSHFGVWKTESESIPAWVMRSGALVTMMALMADHLLSEALPRLTNALSKFASLISFLRKVALVEVILGTAIWGYGDRIFY
ncbi:hypothetical protein D9M70_261290 [compost metagenome]